MSVEIVERRAYSAHRTIVILRGEAWVTFSRPWWHLLDWIWWWLTPGQSTWVTCSVREGDRWFKARLSAKRISRNVVLRGDKPGSETDL